MECTNYQRTETKLQLMSLTWRYRGELRCKHDSLLQRADDLTEGLPPAPPTTTTNSRRKTLETKEAVSVRALEIRGDSMFCAVRESRRMRWVTLPLTFYKSFCPSAMPSIPLTYALEKNLTFGMTNASAAI